jgi:hypothetical protein
MSVHDRLSNKLTMPNEHLHPTTLLVTLRQAGIPVRAARNTTWQQLVRDAPPQVLANALGINPATAMRHAERAGADWTRYAATLQGELLTPSDRTFPCGDNRP